MFLFGFISRNCKSLRKTKTNWETKLSQEMFDSGYLLASGLSHIMISHMPPKLLKVVNLIGIHGEYTIGMANVTKTAFMFTGIASHLSKIALILKTTYVDTHLGLESKNLDVCEQILQNEMKIYPNVRKHKLSLISFSKLKSCYYFYNSV